MNGPASPRIEQLDRETCMRLLGTRSFGRLAVVIAGQPVIFPVNYVVQNRAVVLRTDAGTKFHGALHEPVAFEVDDVDREGKTGWSIVVTGRAELVDTEREPELLREGESGPWALGPKEHWVRIRFGALSGRRVGGGEFRDRSGTRRRRRLRRTLRPEVSP